nr:uncharacterized protein CI109_007062 [Kwoniella shandongensis]KAA5524627.1 hypothetical protein CI109_007062 [Kwoniella shandongensis]
MARSTSKSQPNKVQHSSGPSGSSKIASSTHLGPFQADSQENNLQGFNIDTAYPAMSDDLTQVGPSNWSEPPSSYHADYGVNNPVYDPAASTLSRALVPYTPPEQADELSRPSLSSSDTRHQSGRHSKGKQPSAAPTTSVTGSSSSVPSHHHSRPHSKDKGKGKAHSRANEHKHRQHATHSAAPQSTSYSPGVTYSQPNDQGYVHGYYGGDYGNTQPTSYAPAHFPPQNTVSVAESNVGGTGHSQVNPSQSASSGYDLTVVNPQDLVQYGVGPLHATHSGYSHGYGEGGGLHQGSRNAPDQQPQVEYSKWDMNIAGPYEGPLDMVGYGGTKDWDDLEELRDDG